MSEIQQSNVPSEGHGLDVAPMTLFEDLEPGVHYLKDPVTGQYSHLGKG
jgi:hypothetical protein